MKFITPYWTPIKEANGSGLSGARALLWYALENDLCKNYLVPAGRRALKSLLMKRHLARCLHGVTKYGAGRYFYAAPTIGQVKRIAFESTLRLIPPDGIKRVYRSKDELRIVMLTGAELWFVGLDVPERIEGDEDGWDGGVIDETANIANPDAIAAHIEPAMGTRDGWLAYIGVPDFNGPSSPEYHKLWQKAIRWDETEYGTGNDGGKELRAALRLARETGKRVEFAGFSWDSDVIMNPELVAYYSRRLSPRLFRQEIKASWESAPGLAYEEFNELTHVKPTEYLRGVPLSVSCDFNYGFHNWNIYQVTAPKEVDGMPFFRAVDQVFTENATVYKQCDELATKVKAIDPTLITGQARKRFNSGVSYTEYRTVKGMLKFYGDYSGIANKAEATSSAWGTIRKVFPDAEFYYQMQGPITNGLNDANNALRSSDGTIRVQIDSKCEELIEDFKYVKRDDVLSQKKGGRRTHASDNFRYLVKQVRVKTAQEKVMPKRAGN